MLGILLAVLVGMTVHEFAHNLVAHWMGDPTPSRQRRLTLNPLVHIYWPGFLMFVIIGFGPLGAAPINHNLMRNPRWGKLFAVAAGPISNLLIAAVGGIIWQVMGIYWWDHTLIGDLLYMMVLFNVLLFIFNLLPLFPLDGWHITLALLPPDQAYAWQRNAQTTSYIFFGLILLSFANIPGIDPFGLIIGKPLEVIVELLLGLDLWA
jgi:Zn-dependent protease